jgi:hypothetical protein
VKKTKLSLVLVVCLLLQSPLLHAQNNRLNTNNSIAWIANFITIPIQKKWSAHVEYQWRRANLVEQWQQSLLRVGLTYQSKPSVQCRVGYAWAETFPYGEYAINGFGKDFTEHRIFQMIQLNNKESIFEINHRFMLEQRFVGKYLSSNSTTEDEYPLWHRFRYLGKVSLPLQGKIIKAKVPYLSVYDEFFIGFGKNVNANIFDQNRIGILLGYKFNPIFKLEAGYLNQTLQFGRQISSKNVFQNNNGIVINAFYNIPSL